MSKILYLEKPKFGSYYGLNNWYYHNFGGHCYSNDSCPFSLNDLHDLVFDEAVERKYETFNKEITRLQQLTMC